MDVQSILRYIDDEFSDTAVVVADGSYYIFTGPDRMMPFATIVTGDDHDTASNLSRPGVFRLNIGVSKSTFVTLFGPDEVAYDFAALDTLMPHPVYAAQHWLCVVSPSDATFVLVKPLLAEAYKRAAERKRKRPQSD